MRLLEVFDNADYKIQGRLIWTHSNKCRIKYVRDVIDPLEWDSTFGDLLAQRLAADMAYGLTKVQSVADSNYAIYDRKLKQARHIDSTEDVLDAMGGDGSYLIGARY